MPGGPNGLPGFFSSARPDVNSRCGFAKADILYYIGSMKILLLISVLLFAACASTEGNVQSHEANSPATARKLTSYARGLIGTPFKYGGYSPKAGFDCSGFVDYVFRHSAHVSLPHNAHKISRHGFPVRSTQLREGDLVFYDTNHSAYSHVGIYLGNGRFIHAPSSGGRVRMENMRKAYWKKHYSGARRIVLRD
jgi:cell wall-associated NlpC family hydrolase